MNGERAVHVAVVHRRYASMILAGEKTAELRLTRTRSAPHGRVSAMDRLYFKQASGPIVATAVVSAVETLSDLKPALVDALRRRVNPLVLGDAGFWAHRRDALYASVVHFNAVEPCRFGPDITELRRANPRSAWLILPAQADVYPACVERGLFNASR
ncbi:MAG: ASCH domain-containing protein [Phycisphaerales bacterium]